MWLLGTYIFPFWQVCCTKKNLATLVWFENKPSGNPEDSTYKGLFTLTAIFVSRRVTQQATHR
jgi:hypothetical protein